MFWWCCGDFTMTGLINDKIDAVTGSHLDNGAHLQNNAKRKENNEQRQPHYDSIFTYNSELNYGNRYGEFENPSSDQQLLEITNRNREKSDWLLEYACTFFSSSIFALTLPFSLFFTLKFVGPFERLVVMRLGRARGVYGQGTVLLLPMIDKGTIVDLRVSSVELPALHVITVDKGMLEIVVVAFTRVSDPLVVCCALQNKEQITNSLAYTALNRHLSKRMLNDITNSASLNRILVKCQEELNNFIRPHGIQVDSLTVNQLKILKPAENAAISVFQTLVKSDIGKQLIEHVRTAIGDINAGNVAEKQQEHQKEPKIQRELTNSNNKAQEIIIDFGDDHKMATSLAKQESVPPISVDPELDMLLLHMRKYVNEQLVRRVQKCYRITCVDSNIVNEKKYPMELDLDLRTEQGWCGWTWQRKEAEQPKPDVHFTLNKATLIALCKGQLSPMKAYMNGLVTIQGSIQDSIGLKYLAECAAFQNTTNSKNAVSIDMQETKKCQ